VIDRHNLTAPVGFCNTLFIESFEVSSTNQKAGKYRHQPNMNREIKRQVATSESAGGEANAFAFWNVALDN